MKKLLIVFCCLPLLFGCKTSSLKASEDAEILPSAQTEAIDSAAQEYLKKGTWIGNINEIMKTSFFELTVVDVSVLYELQNYIIQEDMKVLAVEVMIHNAMDETVPMLDTDFQIQWEDESEDAYSWPITSCTDQVIFENQPVSEVQFMDQLACRYELDVEETISGVLYYEVPIESKKYSLSYREYFSNEEYGDTYALIFSVD